MPELDLSSKGLAELPVDKLKGLTKLDANSNALTKLTKGCFDGSPDLESVEVYANKIKEIEAWRAHAAHKVHDVQRVQQPD